eukprot:TRINITY_DN113_c0_g1_i1.p1 TRINITY_DN113_c0_g1~~TRINITY_DN113_c0_g1_i1.p1  ORF type:complete len:349 (-),score=46.52 TRINITY_DN113_c0_g1_i1:113-1159(-)
MSAGISLSNAKAVLFFFFFIKQVNYTQTKMKFVVLLVLALCVASALATPDVKSQFLGFQQKFNKVYASEEEFQTRFQIFQDNLKVIAAKNALNNGATYGVTQFTDMTKEEFKATVLMNNLPPLESGDVAPTNYSAGAPTSFDWRSRGGVVTGVYNQGQCGSCWAFSATENVESRWALAGHGLTSLSMQQVVSCDRTDGGCNGGWPYNAYQYLIGAGGQESYAAYPYTAENTPCEFNAGAIVARPRGWQYVTQSRDENQMVNYLYANGPLSVCVDASDWSFYSGGVFPASSCSTSIDHCVDAVGYNLGGSPYWIIRNSWGTSWGIAGYMYLQFGANACAVAQVVTSSTM